MARFSSGISVSQWYSSGSVCCSLHSSLFLNIMLIMISIIIITSNNNIIVYFLSMLLNCVFNPVWILLAFPKAVTTP